MAQRTASGRPRPGACLIGVVRGRLITTSGGVDVLDTPRGCALRPVRSHRRTTRGDCRPHRDAPLSGVRGPESRSRTRLRGRRRGDRTAVERRPGLPVTDRGWMSTTTASASRSTTTARVSRSSARRAQTRSAAAECGSSIRSRRRGARSRDRRASASGPRCRSPARLQRTWTAAAAATDSGQPGERAGQRTDGLRRAVAITLTGAVNVAQGGTRALPRTGRRPAGPGRPLLGKIGAPDRSSYVTAKWAVHGLARTLQVEARERTCVEIRLVSPAASTSVLQLLSVEAETSLPGSRTHARTSVGGARRSGVMRVQCRGLEGGAARLGYQTLGAGRLSEQQVPRHPCLRCWSQKQTTRPGPTPQRVRGGTPSGPEVSLLGGERDPRETGRQVWTVIRREGSRWAPTVPCLRGRSARGPTAQARWKPLHGARPLQVEGSPPHLESDGGAAQLLREAGRRRRMPAGSTGRVPQAPPSAAPSMTSRRSGRCR